MPDPSDSLTRWAVVSHDSSQDLTALLRISQPRLTLAMESATGEEVVRVQIEKYPDSISRIRERILDIQTRDWSDSIFSFATKKTIEICRQLYESYCQNKSTTGDDQYMKCFRDLNQIYPQIADEITKTSSPIELVTKTERDLKEWISYWRDSAASWTRSTGGTLFQESMMLLCEALNDLSESRLLQSSYHALKEISAISAYLQAREVYPNSSFEYGGTWYSTFRTLAENQLHDLSIDLESHLAQSLESTSGDQERDHSK